MCSGVSVVSVNTSRPLAGERNAFDAQEETFPPHKVCEMSRGGQGGRVPGGSNLAPGAAVVAFSEWRQVRAWASPSIRWRREAVCLWKSVCLEHAYTQEVTFILGCKTFYAGFSKQPATSL